MSEVVKGPHERKLWALDFREGSPQGYWFSNSLDSGGFLNATAEEEASISEDLTRRRAVTISGIATLFCIDNLPGPVCRMHSVLGAAGLARDLELSSEQHRLQSAARTGKHAA
jgi:hypothetical protein